MRHQVYISSYKKDAEWLRHCLYSLKKFQSGFLPPVVGVAAEDFDLIVSIAQDVFPETDVVASGEPSWMGAQIRMMEADRLCPEADVIYFLGSDCIAYETFNPSWYCDAEEKPYVLFTPFEQLRDYPGAYAWRSGVERVLNIGVDHEFMRRIPSVYPQSIFAPMRDYVERIHNQPFAEYITQADAIHKNTSEANILGAYAFHFMRETCHFVSTDHYTAAEYPSAILQMWSHGGFDRPTDAVCTLPDGSCSVGRPPRELINTLLYS